MNRYEHLFGYTYTRLVNNLANELSREEDIPVTSVLLFKSFNENLYYVGFPSNPLLTPSEVEKLTQPVFQMRSHFSARCLWHLASYLRTNEGIAMITNVFREENKRLVDSNASTFNLTYSNYNQLKEEWLTWIIDLSRRNIDWKNLPKNENELREHPLIRQTFILSNLLLIMMPVAITSTHRSEGNNAASIYQIIMGKSRDKGRSKWLEDTGEFKVLHKGFYKWKYAQNRVKSYGPLLDVIEFTLFHPLMARKKEAILGAYVHELMNNRPTRPFPTYQFSLMVYPLFYNAEFQGIIYATKRIGEFTESDKTRFIESIRNRKFESRLADAKFDLARIAISRDEKNFLDKSPLLRVLENIHHFTSACSGIAIVEDGKGNSIAEEIYRISKGSRTEMAPISRNDAHEIKEIIETKVFKENSDPVWLFKHSKLLHTLLQLPVNGVKYTAKSAVVLSIDIEDKKLGYLILFYEESEAIINQFSFHRPSWGQTERSRDVFAERIHTSIIRLIDADQEHRRILKAEKEVNRQKANDLELMTPHKMVNSFEPRVVIPLREVEGLIKDENIKRRVSLAVKYLVQYMDGARNFSKAWRNYLNYRRNINEKIVDKSINEKIMITPPKLEGVVSRIKDTVADQVMSFEHNLVKYNETILTSPEIFDYLLDLLISNALEVYDDHNIPVEKRKVEIRFSKSSSYWDEHDQIDPFLLSNRDSITIISVWNSETRFSESKIKHAGFEPFSDNPKRTGFGFYFLQSALFHLEAIRLEKERHFILRNTDSPKGAEVIFGLWSKGAN